MDPESQANIKKIAESDGFTKDQIIVVLGASDIEGAEISAETVTFGDPSFAGPLAGVPLGLPVYHILEPEIWASGAWLLTRRKLADGSRPFGKGWKSARNETSPGMFPKTGDQTPRVWEKRSICRSK